MKHTTATLQLLMAVTAPFVATAQDQYDIPESPVENVLQARAQNPAQQAIGTLIEDVCPPGAAFPAGTPGSSKADLAPTQDLKQRCDEMWSNSLFGRDVPNVLAGLQSSANEEDAALGTLTTDISGQSSAVGNRLAGLRAGNGAAVAMQQYERSGRTIALARRFDLGAPLAAGDAASPWSAFVTGEYSITDRDATARETGFDGDRYGVTAGLDYTFGAGAVAGLAINYAHDDNDLSAGGGTLEADTYGVTGYVSYGVGAAGYVDFKVGYQISDYDQRRNIRYTIQAVDPNTFAALPGVFTTVNQVAVSDTESDEAFVDVLIGNDWNIDPAILGAWMGTYYGDTTIDGFSERMSDPNAAGSGLALFVDEQSPVSLLAKVGANLRFTTSLPFGVVYPYVLGEYVHEFENDDDPITGGFVDDPNAFRFSLPIDAPDRDFFNVGAGVVAPVSDSGSLFFRYQGLVGYDDLILHVFELGARLSF